MLVMFAAGVAVLWWMAALTLVMVYENLTLVMVYENLTLVMVYEKTWGRGRPLGPVVGVARLVLAAARFAHPPWLASPFPH